MNEKPDTIHGRLLEAVHISSYGFERACGELEYLLDEDRWKQCGDGFEDIDDFLFTINFSDFKIAAEQRKKLAKKLADMRATQRAIGGALGVSEATVNRDINPVTNETKQKEQVGEYNELEKSIVTDVTPPIIQKSGAEIIAVANKAIEKEEKQAAKERDTIERQEELSKRPLPNIKNVHHGDFNETCNQFNDGSIDHIFTDPPYSAEYLPQWELLANQAKRILKPSGFCICYSGTFNLPYVYKILSGHLIYYWTLVLLHTGGNQFIHPRHLNTGWKPILVFQKYPFKRIDKSFTDIIKGSGREKGDHEWRQAENEAIDILEIFTTEKDIILDPFAGTGTIHIASIKCGRVPVSIEKEEIHLKVLGERYVNAVNT